MVFSTFNMDNLGKICRHHWKERLNISKIVKFESDTFYASKDCENLQTFVWWGGQVCAPHPYKHLQNFTTLRSYISVSFQQITFYLGNFINLEALFLVVSMDSLQLVHAKSWKKKTWKGLYMVSLRSILAAWEREMDSTVDVNIC